MRLKPQPAPARRPPRARRSGASRMGARPRGRMARRPGVPLRRRIGGRLPSLRRLIAVAAAGAAVSGLVALVNGPWLRVGAVGWDGAHHTPVSDLRAALADEEGRSVLVVDTDAVRRRLEALPSVASASVTASLTGYVEARLTERVAAFVWETDRGRFLVAEDGTVFRAYGADEPLPEATASLPRVADRRVVSRLVSVGDRLPPELIEPTAAVLAIDPAALGSRTARVSVQLDDEYGFRLVSEDPPWEVALGVYGTDPRETAADAAARLEAQVTAVRTLFAQQPEAGVRWVDVRNPGKVYFRAGG